MNKAKLSRIVRNTPCALCSEKVMAIINYMGNGSAVVECGKCGQVHEISIQEFKDKINIMLTTAPNCFKRKR